jgi:hypothetical protein
VDAGNSNSILPLPAPELLRAWKFERVQKVEEKFHKDFDGIDFTQLFARKLWSTKLEF